MKRSSLIICLSLWFLLASGQSNIAVKYFGLTIHPFGDDFARYQPYKLDKNAVVVFNYGGLFEYEKYIHENEFSIKFIQGLFADCSAGKASATFLGIKGSLQPIGRHRLGIAAGPLFIVRESWSRFSDYKSSRIFKEKKDTSLGDIQYAFYAYGIVIEYDYQVGSRTDLSLSFTPGFPFVLTFGFGVKYWISKDFHFKPKQFLKLR